MPIGGVSQSRFMRRVRCRYKQDAIQVKPIRRFPRQRQVCLVNRVERAAENRQPQLAYALSIFTEWIRTSLTGRSCELRGTPEIFCTTV